MIDDNRLGAFVSGLAEEGEPQGVDGPLFVLPPCCFPEVVVRLLSSWVRRSLVTERIGFVTPDASGAKPLALSFAFEGTFAWFNWSRRLSKDYELRHTSAETMIHIAFAHLLLRRSP